MKTKLTSLLLTLFLLFPCTLSAQPQPSTYDVLIKGGTVYDGTGAAPINADVAIQGYRIVAIGDLKNARARTVIGARSGSRAGIHQHAFVVRNLSDCRLPFAE